MNGGTGVGRQAGQEGRSKYVILSGMRIYLYIFFLFLKKKVERSREDNSE